jgi:flagellin
MSQNAITLTSGMRKNLFSLQNTNSLLERTQKRMATGQRVQTAVDDPVNYFTALGHRQRAEDLASRKDEMSESIQLVMSANEGVTAITSLIASAKSLAQSALSAATQEEVTTLEGQYNEVLSQINQLVSDSGYKGVNLLGGDDVSHEVKFNENGSSKLTMTGFDASTGTNGLDIGNVGAGNEVQSLAAAKLIIGDSTNYITVTATTEGAAGNNFSIQIVQGEALTTSAALDTNSGVITVSLGTPADEKRIQEVRDAIDGVTGVGAAITGAATTPVTTMATTSLSGGSDKITDNWWDGTTGVVNKSGIGFAIGQLDDARTTLRSESQKLSTNLSTITIRQDFTKGMINTLEDGAAELTNADMNQEGANMLMLQTRQSLGTTSLSLASQAAQSVLRLF